MQGIKDITLQSIYEAAKRVEGIVKETPLWKSSELGAQVFLKLENMHEIGAFKIRGAANKILSLSETEKNRGVTTFSTGNHGLAVASLAGKLGIRAVICISNRVPDAKVRRLERLGAEVEKVGYNQDDALAYAYELEKNEGLTVIPPFDDPHVIAGQGTIGLEIIQRMPDVETVIIPVSGGGLFAGISFVLKKYNPNIQIVGVSMEHSAVMYESMQAGKIVTLEEKDTLADSLLGGIGDNNQYTFEIVKQYIDEFVLLTEEEIANGMKFMLNEHQFAVEGAAATSVATILSEKIHVNDEKTVCLITGRNVDTDAILKACRNE